MGHNKENGPIPSWSTFVESETKTCIAGRVNMRQIIAGLNLPDLVQYTNLAGSESFRHVVYAAQGTKIEKNGTDHVTVILFEEDPNKGVVRPKRKLIDTSDTHYVHPAPETQKSKTSKSSASTKVEYQVIPFSSAASKKLAIREGLYRAGVSEPKDFVTSQPFIKHREKRLFRHQNGLLLEAAGDTIITIPETLQRIELEIAPPFFANTEYIKQLETSTQDLRNLLAEQGLTVASGISNSTLMKRLLTQQDEISSRDIKAILKRSKKEKETRNNKSQLDRAA